MRFYSSPAAVLGIPFALLGVPAAPLRLAVGGRHALSVDAIRAPNSLVSSNDREPYLWRPLPRRGGQGRLCAAVVRTVRKNRWPNVNNPYHRHLVIAFNGWSGSRDLPYDGRESQRIPNSRYCGIRRRSSSGPLVAESRRSGCSSLRRHRNPSRKTKRRRGSSRTPISQVGEDHV